MTRIFFDSSALFAAILSSRGAARELMRRHMRGELTLVINWSKRLPSYSTPNSHTTIAPPQPKRQSLDWPR